MLHNPGTLPLPIYNMTRHPIETWQEWYIKNQTVIDIQVHITNQVEMYGVSVVDDPSFDIRNIAPYEYIDSLNQRQIWEPFLTGRERQEFDTHLRRFMDQNRSASLRLRPAPIVPPSSNSPALKFRPLNSTSNTSQSSSASHSSSTNPSSFSSSSSNSSSKSKRSSQKHKSSSSSRHYHSSRSSSARPSNASSKTIIANPSIQSSDPILSSSGMSQFQVTPFDAATASYQNATSSSYQLNSYHNYQSQPQYPNEDQYQNSGQDPRYY